MKIGRLSLSPLDLLFVFFPIAFALEFAHADPVWIFVTACLGVVPLAGLMGKATEHLAAHFGPGLSGLLNATFGNAAELIIAIMALRRGMLEVVVASLTGSIIGNVLLVLGLALLLGGFKHARQTFNRTAAGLGSTLLALSAVGLVVPAMFATLRGVVHGAEMDDADLGRISLIISIILFTTYLLSLVFSLKTHRHLFAGEPGGHGHDHGHTWSRRKAMLVLLGATVGVGVIAELLVGAVEHTAAAWSMPEVFVGVILVAVVGNVAEHSTAVLMAVKNRMDLAMNIAIGSSIQIALLIAPLLVFLSYALGHPLTLSFSPMEVTAVVLSVAVVALVAHDGESHWMEGVLLLAVYGILGVTFFHMG